MQDALNQFMHNFPSSKLLSVMAGSYLYHWSCQNAWVDLTICLMNFKSYTGLLKALSKHFNIPTSPLNKNSDRCHLAGHISNFSSQTEVQKPFKKYFIKIFWWKNVSGPKVILLLPENPSSPGLCIECTVSGLASILYTPENKLWNCVKLIICGWFW